MSDTCRTTEMLTQLLKIKRGVSDQLLDKLF